MFEPITLPLNFISVQRIVPLATRAETFHTNKYEFHRTTGQLRQFPLSRGLGG